MAASFGVFVDGASLMPALYWLPKLHKRHLNPVLLLNLVHIHVLLLSCPCLTAIKNMLLKYFEKVYVLSVVLGVLYLLRNRESFALL